MKKHVILLLALSLALSFKAKCQVVFTQILYDTPLNEQVTITPYSNGEFIELYNISEQNIDLSQWGLYGDGVTEKYTFPSGTTIQGRSHLIVAYSHKKSPDFVLSSLFNNIAQLPILYQNKVILKNGGEAIRLHNQYGTLVDSIYFDGTSHKSKPDRLSAENADSIMGNLCVSLQRTYVAYNEHGCAITDNSHWETQQVSIGTIEPQVQPYITNDFYWDSNDYISSGNYIMDVTPLDECNSLLFGTDGALSFDDGCRAQITITHINVIGQNIQTTQRAASPTGEDIVTYSEYEQDTRTIRTWLPVVSEGKNILSLESIQALATAQYNDGHPYASTQKEISKRGRTESTTLPGDVYQDHASSIEYNVNTLGIPHLVVNENGFYVQGEYPVGSLRVITTIDADGKKQTKMLDMYENAIVVRIGNDLDTYYIYDDWGHLRYILPPAITSQLTNNNSYNDNDDLIRNYAYVYRYDKYGNQIYKRLPGAEQSYMVYDKAGRLVLQQDGNQRARGNLWLMTKYDDYGRAIYIQECDMSNWNYMNLLDTISKLSFTETYAPASASVKLGNTGYTNTLFAMPNSKILVVNYYDNYDFLDLLPNNKISLLQYKNEKEYGQRYDNALGLATGSITYNLSDNQYTITTNYYDIYGNIIQARNTSLQGGYHAAYTAYNFDGTKHKQMITHNSDIAQQTEKYTYSYDHAGRPIETRYKVNDIPWRVHTKYVYNMRGNLVQTLRHNAIDTTIYQYTPHGALTKISNELFSEQLFYADSIPTYAIASYNGNISAATICMGDSTYRFAYNYDDYNRLVESFYMGGGELQSSEYFEFDKMGDLKRLQRYSLQNRLLDDLTFTMEGNQVCNITDYSTPTNLYNTKEYYNLSADNEEEEMVYDANGNLIADLDRGITEIKYNLYNLPDTIFFSNGNKIINHYGTRGDKWKTEFHTIIDDIYLSDTTSGIVFDGIFTDIRYTIYDGNIEYKYINNGTGVDSLYEYIIHNTEGYITYHPYDNTMTQCYYHRDHLGNICAVWDATHDSIVQQTLYYASGLPVSVSTGQGVQPYKYNSKEYVEMHGYDVYEYGARGYYATIGRFTSIDPLCEQTPWQSPYVYANNNWVNNIDWMGMSADGFHIPTLNWVAVDGQGTVLGYDMQHPDQYVYLIDDENWDGSYDGLSDYSAVGWQIPFVIYSIDRQCPFIALDLSGIYTHVPGGTFSFVPCAIESSGEIISDILTISDLSVSVLGNYKFNEFYWFGKNRKLYLRHMIHKRGGYAYSRKVAEAAIQPIKRVTSGIGVFLATYSIGNEIVDIIEDRSITGSNALNVTLASISITCTILSGPVAAGFLLGVGVYSAFDLIYGWSTGTSITERIDKPIIEW